MTNFSTTQLQRLQIYARALSGKSGLDRNDAIIAAKAIFDEFGPDVNPNMMRDCFYKVCSEYFIRFDIADDQSMRTLFEIYREVVASGITWEQLLVSENREYVSAPKVLIDEMLKHFKSTTNTVLIPDAEVFAPYLTYIISEHPECRFTLTTANAKRYKILTKQFEIKDGLDELDDTRTLFNVEVINSSMYEYGFVDRKFDLIFAIPVFGVRDRVEFSNFLCKEYENIALENLLLHLTIDGRLAIVMPAKITFAAGQVRELRSFVQDMYRLEEIDELPTGIFTATGIKTYLLTISTGHTDDVVCRQYVADTDKPKKDGIKELILKEDTFVMLDELRESGDWNLNKIFAQQDEEWMNYQNSSVRKGLLRDAAEIFRGKSVNRKDEHGNVGVINISNIQEHAIDYDGLDHLQEEERKITNFVLKPGDLLIPARGTTLKVGVFENQSYPCIPSSNLIVIRPNAKVLNGTYLKIFLDSPVGNKLIASMQQGTSSINISYKDLMDMEIPIPSIEEQEQMANTYKTELGVYLQVVSEATSRWNEALAKLQNNI